MNERIAQLQYEAGMYQSLYETAKARIEALEAALREIASDEHSFIEVLEIARAALDKDEGR